MNGCNVSFAESGVEDCLELNFKYVDYQSLAYLSYSSCVCWISVRATKAQRFLSVRESISVSVTINKDLKNIKNVKGCIGMACQKVCKQGRDELIVKVNLQTLIPTSFSH